MSSTDTDSQPKEIVTHFQQHGLPIAAIADMARVERQTIYNWLHGEPVEECQRLRLLQLHKLLTQGKTTSFRHLYRLWHRPLSQAASLSDLLRQEPLDEQAIAHALAPLWPLAEQHQEQSQKRPQSSDMKKNPLLAEIPEVSMPDGL